MNTEQMINEIRHIAEDKNAIILAHNYQNPEIQDLANYSGDSLELARIAAKNDADIIIFCGVHFMAESAAMLSPQKKVILPEFSAGCPMADMAVADDLIEMKKTYPYAKVISYINTSAAVKAQSDVICTSANAVKIVQRVDADEIIFLPDKNLASYVQRFTDKNIIPWHGFCPTHENFTVEQLKSIKQKHPDALVIVHPECRAGVVDLADETLSTGGMVRFVEKTQHRKIIVGTEIGMIHRLKKSAPHIEFIAASESFICPDMKKINLEKVLNSLINEKPVITVDPETCKKAGRALDAMLELSD